MAASNLAGPHAGRPDPRARQRAGRAAARGAVPRLGARAAALAGRARRCSRSGESLDAAERTRAQAPRRCAERDLLLQPWCGSDPRREGSRSSTSSSSGVATTASWPRPISRARSAPCSCSSGGPILGGACVTEEIHPGFRCSTTSYVCSLLRPRIIRELSLAARARLRAAALRHLLRALPDGSHLLLGHRASGRTRSSSRGSRSATPRPTRASTPRWSGSRISCVRRSTLTPPDLTSAGPPRRARAAEAGAALRRLGQPPTRPCFIKVMTMSVASLLDEWFESPEIKAMLAGSGTIGIYGGPSTPGTAFVLLHHLLGEAGGEPGAWGFVRGAWAGITQAMATRRPRRGRRAAHRRAVARIRVENGARPTGVVLESGEEIDARVVVSNADPKRTFLKLARPGRPARRLPHRHRELPLRGQLGEGEPRALRAARLHALPGDGPHLRGSIQVCGGDIAYLERAFQDYTEGRPSAEALHGDRDPVDGRRLPVSGREPRDVRLDQVPAAHTAPRASGRTASRSSATSRSRRSPEYAPNLRDIGARLPTCSRPECLEETYGLTGGNVFHGDMAADQLFTQRPLFGWARYRTPVSQPLPLRCRRPSRRRGDGLRRPPTQREIARRSRRTCVACRRG